MDKQGTGGLTKNGRSLDFSFDSSSSISYSLINSPDYDFVSIFPYPNQTTPSLSLFPLSCPLAPVPWGLEGETSVEIEGDAMEWRGELTSTSHTMNFAPQPPAAKAPIPPPFVLNPTGENERQPVPLSNPCRVRMKVFWNTSYSLTVQSCPPLNSSAQFQISCPQLYPGPLQS